MTSDARPNRTTAEILAGLAAVQNECSRSVTGDPLHTLTDGGRPPNPFAGMFPDQTTVEFRAATLSRLVADAVVLICRLEESDHARMSETRELRRIANEMEQRAREAEEELDNVRSIVQAYEDDVARVERRTLESEGEAESLRSLVAAYIHDGKTDEAERVRLNEEIARLVRVIRSHEIGDLLATQAGETASPWFRSTGMTAGRFDGAGENSTFSTTDTRTADYRDREGNLWDLVPIDGDGRQGLVRHGRTSGTMRPESYEVVRTLFGPLTGVDVTDGPVSAWEGSGQGETPETPFGTPEEWGRLVLGDELTDRDGDVWRVVDFRDGEPMVNRAYLGADASLADPVSVIAGSWGPLTLRPRTTDVSEEATEAERDADDPPAPMFEGSPVRVGDRFTTRRGSEYVVAEVRNGIPYLSDVERMRLGLGLTPRYTLSDLETDGAPLDRVVYDGTDDDDNE